MNTCLVLGAIVSCTAPSGRTYDTLVIGGGDRRPPPVEMYSPAPTPQYDLTLYGRTGKDPYGYSNGVRCELQPCVNGCLYMGYCKSGK